MYDKVSWIFLIAMLFSVPVAFSSDVLSDFSCKEMENDVTGTSKIVCRSSGICSESGDKRIMRDRCNAIGAELVVEKDIDGCDRYLCKTPARDGIFNRYQKCMTDSEINDVLADCRRAGYSSYMEKSGGCMVPICRPSTDPENISSRERCILSGGEYIEKTTGDDEIFSLCIKHNGKDDVEMAPVEIVPEHAELLQLTFKLEALKIKLNELFMSTDRLSTYYKSMGDNENSEKFKRISLLVLNAKDEIDKIKNKIASQQLANATKGDILEIKHDLNYVRDVILNNILFEMLGSENAGDETRECESIDCIEDSIITCVNGTVLNTDKYSIKIFGIENERCVIFFENGSGVTCKVPDYPLGIRDPETQLRPYCNGKISDIVADADNSRPEVYITQATETGMPGNDLSIVDRIDESYIAVKRFPELTI